MDRRVELSELSEHEQGIVKHRRLTKTVLIEELWLSPVHPEIPVSLISQIPKSVSNQADEFQLLKLFSVVEIFFQCI